MATTSKGNSPSKCEPMRRDGLIPPGSSMSLATIHLARYSARSFPRGRAENGRHRTAAGLRSHKHPPCALRRGLRNLPHAIRSDAPSICGRTQRARLLFQAKLLRFRAFSGGRCGPLVASRCVNGWPKKQKFGAAFLLRSAMRSKVCVFSTSRSRRTSGLPPYRLPRLAYLRAPPTLSPHL